MKKVLFIVGPTASGKSELAKKMASELCGEVISADSRQVYKFLDIGTAKDKTFPQHMISAADPRTQTMTVADYVRQARQIIADIHARGKLAIVVGGSGLYIDALLRGYEFPPNKKYRGQFSGRAKKPNWNVEIIGIKIDRQKLYQKIDARLEERLKKGLVDEVRKLKKMGLSDDQLDSFGLEYRFVLKYLKGQIDYREMAERLKGANHQFARRQYNWLKRWPVRWVDPEKFSKD